MTKLILIVLLLASAIAHALDSNPFAAESAVYKIEIQNGNVLHYGTGVLIARDKILTNCHVVRNPGFIRVIHRQSGQQYQPALSYNLGNYDACILQGNFPMGEPVTFADRFETGQIVWHYGYPHGVVGSGQGPIVGAVNTEQGTVIESASYCNPGSSGGPLLNAQGQLVGLNFATRATGNRDMCLSIPAFVLRPFIRF